VIPPWHFNEPLPLMLEPTYEILVRAYQDFVRTPLQGDIGIIPRGNEAHMFLDTACVVPPPYMSGDILSTHKLWHAYKVLKKEDPGVGRRLTSGIRTYYARALFFYCLYHVISTSYPCPKNLPSKSP
jgi:hypothetical protein